MKKEILAMLSCLVMSATHAASFECEKASSKAEKSICSNSTLSSLDDKLDRSYKIAKSRYTAQGRTSLFVNQEAWLYTVRNRCSSESCLEDAYRSRIQVIEADSAAAAEEPCSHFIQMYRRDPTSIRSDGERFLGEFCSDKYEPRFCGKPIMRKEDLSKLGFQLADPDTAQILASADIARTSVSEVDVDNDGTPDLRFSGVSGSLGCTGNAYFKKISDGRYIVMNESEYAYFDDPARTCPGQFLFPRYKGIVYVINADKDIEHIWRGHSKGISEICIPK